MIFILPAFERLRQEDYYKFGLHSESQARQGCIARFF